LYTTGYTGSLEPPSHGVLPSCQLGSDAGSKGVTTPRAIKDGNDFYGKNVILASRVAGTAVGGEILMSSLVRSLVESSVGASTFGEPRELGLKGLAGTHTVHAVTATRRGTVTMTS
jgi:class 3 adenylate cyclase